jgi:branched-chain amino acid transport system substrate-binding protein
MAISRRAFVHTAAIGSVAAAGLALSSRPGRAETDSVNVASLHDLSGAVDVYGIPSHMCMKAAVEEINAAGGLLGKQLVLKTYDGQSDIKKYPQYAQQAALQDRVVMLQGSITGASREATRPVLRRYKVPFVYGTIYEGGLCEMNAISVNTGSDQQAVPLLEWAFQNLGKKVFYIGADYNAPRNIGIWTHYLAGQHGGQVVGDDYYPLDVTDFSTAISKIQAAKPDYVHSCLVGGPHMAFYRQWAAAGMLHKIPIVSIVFAGGNEHMVLTPEETDGIIVAYNYFQELETPANKAFLARIAASAGADHPYVNGIAIGGYNGPMIWAEAVRKAGSFERDALMDAVAGGIEWNGPGGRMVLDGKTHSTQQDVHIIQVKDRRWTLIETKQQVMPYDFAGRCDLVKNPRNTEILVPLV